MESAVPCPCGSTVPLQTIRRCKGRSTSYRLRCAGCGRTGNTTFHPEQKATAWNTAIASEAAHPSMTGDTTCRNSI